MRLAKLHVFTYLVSVILGLAYTSKTYAWIGTGVATLKGTQTTDSTNINQTTPYAIEWSSSEYDTDFYTHDPSGSYPERLYVDANGDYLVAVTIPMVSGDSEQREQVQMEVYVNGSAATGTIGGSSYIRNATSHTEASNHVATMIPNLSSGDYIEVFVWLTGIAGIVNIDSTASMYVEYIDNTSKTVFTGTATQTNAPSSPTNLNQSTAYELAWTEVRENTGFTHSDVSNPEDIQIDSSGYYLLFVNVPVYDSSGTDRQSVLVIPQLDGTTVNGGNAKQGYLRDQSSYNDYSSVHWSGVFYAASDNQILTVQTQRNASAGTTTVPSGKTASIYVERLNGSFTNMISLRGTDLTGGTDWNPSPAQQVEWETNVFKDSTVYTHNTLSNPHQVEVEKAGDYLLVYNDSMGTSTVQRIANKITVQVDGTGVDGAITTTHYIRGGTYNHYESSGSLVFLLEDLMPNNIVTVSTEVEAATGTLNDNQDALLLLWYKGRSDSYTSQLKYRWRNDTTDLNTSGGWLAAENTIWDSAARNTTYRLRVAVANVGDSAESAARTYELQFGEMTTTCEDIATWTGAADASDYINMYATAHITPDGESTTSGLLSNSENYSFVNGEGRESADTTGSIGALSSQGYTELEYSIRPAGTVPLNTTFCFRVYDTTAGAPIDNYENYALLQTRTPNVEQLHYRWRDDSTDLNTGGGWLANEDDDPTTEASVGDTYRLRIETANTGSLAEESAHNFEIQFGKLETSCAAVTSWLGIGDTSDGFDMIGTTHIDPDGETTTSGLLANTEGYTYTNGEGRDTADTTSSLAAMSSNYYRELEFSFSPTASSSPGATYCFRVVDDVGELENYNVYPTLTIEGGFLVQKIIGSISGTLSKTEPINPIASLENAFLLMDFTGATSADNTPGEATCTAHLSSTSAVTIQKSVTSGECQYAVYVIEALKNEFVVRGRGAITIDASELYDTGTANNLSDIIDTSRVFIPANVRSNGNGSDEWRETYATSELTNSTTVTSIIGNNTGADTVTIVRYEVVEFLASGMSVQTGEADLTSLTNADQTVTLDTPVSLSRSFVYATFRHIDDGLAQTSVRMWLSDTDEISFDRATNTVNLDSFARWWVVEFPAGSSTSVQRDLGSAGDTVNAVIDIALPSPVEVSRSFPLFFGSNSGTGNAFPRGRYYSNLVDKSNTQHICGYIGNTFNYAWQVIDTSGFVADPYTFVQNDFEFMETANSVTLTNNWPPGNGDDLIENEALTQIPASNETLSLGDQIRVQMNITVMGDNFPSATSNFRLQYRESNDCTTAGTWTDVGDKGSGIAWRLFDETAIGDSTTQVNNISTSDATAEGYYSEINPTANNPNEVAVNENSEWDWPLENYDANPNSTYCFRMLLDTNDLTLGSYRPDSYPRITTAPGTADLMRHGKFFNEDTLKGYFWAN